jgi:carboxypeptidase C (cathepsin A)
MEAEGRYSEAALRDVETYASGAFVTDLLRGLGDAAATERLVEEVTAITGLAPDTVERAAGRIDAQLFARELLADEGRRLSVYDGTVAGPSPFPEGSLGHELEPVLDALTAPLTAGMLHLHATLLDWHPDRRYQLLNDRVNGGWDWGRDRGQPEVVTTLRRLLALDPALRVLVVHGSADLVTPYFASELILRQLSPEASSRTTREIVRGGHMFYLRQDSRQALRDAAAVLYAGHQR